VPKTCVNIPACAKANHIQKRKACLKRKNDKKSKCKKDKTKVIIHSSSTNPRILSQQKLMIAMLAMPPRPHRRPIALGPRAKIIIIIVTTAIISMIRTLVFVFTIFRPARLGAETINNALAPSTQTSRRRIRSIVTSVSRTVAGAGSGTMAASTPILSLAQILKSKMCGDTTYFDLCSINVLPPNAPAATPASVVSVL
jgi:hypothetical protein